MCLSIAIEENCQWNFLVLDAFVTSALERRLKMIDRFFELVTAARVAESDDCAVVKRQAIRLNWISRPRAGGVDRIADLEFRHDISSCEFRRAERRYG